MDYLIDEIVDRTDHPWTVIYHFVFDRIRAIRQDMVIQRIGDENAVDILEKAVRFHVFAHHKLCNTSLEFYDPYINDSHIQECLKRLLVLYDSHMSSQNRAEFEAYYLLHNLGSHEAIERVLRLPDSLKQEQCLKLSLELSLMKLIGNFVGFFRIVRKLPFLACCLIHKHSLSLWSSALAIMNAAFSNPNCRFPLELFTKILAFGDKNTAKTFVSSFGIEVVDDYIKFSKKSFTEPLKPPTTNDICDFLNGKIPGTIREVIHENIPPCVNNFIKLTPTDSKSSILKNGSAEDGKSKQSKATTVVCGRGRGVRQCLADERNIKTWRGKGRGRSQNITDS
jgi:SAC3 domain-containing protein 1